MDAFVDDTLDLLDFRRRVDELYRLVRESGSGEKTWLGWRAGRDELFSSHPQTPLEVGDIRRKEGLAYFDYDEQWRFELIVEPMEGSVVSVSHSSQGSTAMAVIGRVRLPIGDEPYLTVFRFEQYADGIFVPFRDGTAGTETYGGGRYLLDSPKGADLGSSDDRIVMDFNYAYHPSCVYSDRWSCPLPPRDNWLTDAIPAGERL